MNEIKEGSKVKLKSGGPAMTVEKFKWNPTKGAYDTDKVECSWFHNTKLERDTFQTSSLEVIQD